MLDHGKFLNKNSTYARHGVFSGTSCEQQARGLQDAVYATVKDESGRPIYVQMLLQVIKQYDLKKYDTEAIQVSN